MKLLAIPLLASFALLQAIQAAPTTDGAFDLPPPTNETVVWGSLAVSPSADVLPDGVPAGIPSCTDVKNHLQANPNQDFTQIECYMESGNETLTSVDTPTLKPRVSVNTPVCGSAGTRPAFRDAVNLCNGVNRLSLSPAYSRNTPRCSVFSYGTALFAGCNLDTCNTWQDYQFRNHCYEILYQCLPYARYTYGYAATTLPAGIEVLYGVNTDDNDIVPPYTSCFIHTKE